MSTEEICCAVALIIGPPLFFVWGWFQGRSAGINAAFDRIEDSNERGYFGYPKNRHWN